MTQDPQLSPDKVAELETKLADAAAEVARVRAQLTAATGGAPAADSSRPPAWNPGGTGSSDPHTIIINGQQVTPGSGDLAAMLRQLTLPAAAAAGGGSGGPVVVVNGQTVSGAPAADLSSYLSPQVTQQLQSSLQQLGLGGGFGSLFGHLPPAGTPTAPPPADPSVRLADPPRPVPASYRLATFDLSVYELFILIIGTVAPGIVWITLPEVVPAALLAVVLGIGLFRGLRYRRRIGALKWGKVATVTVNDTLSAGTYYAGMTYNNMRKRQASGWDAETIWYSGPGYKNKVDYTLDGKPGSLTYRGLLYTDGVILADSRDPSRARCVVQFPYSVKPGPDGQFTGRLGVWLWCGIVVTLVVESAIVGLAIASVLGIWLT